MTRVARRVAGFTESVIREMTRKALEHDAINLAQGMPDFPAPAPVKDAARAAIAADINQYAITWGAPALRSALAARLRTAGIEVDPEREVTVTCGATEAMMATLLALVDPGDEVVVFEPYYENYRPDAILAGAVPRTVRLRPPDWTFDARELAAAFGPATRAIVVNTPHNPTGKVFSDDELRAIADLCRTHDALAVTDEIYEHIVYDGPDRPLRHLSMLSQPGMRERTVVVNGASKTYSVTGWRVGWAVAAPPLTAAIRKVHDFLTVGAPAPLQEACAAALRLPATYYVDLREAYRRRRDLLCEALDRAGFRIRPPDGAYYVMAGIGDLGFADDIALADHLVREVGVAVVPGSSFTSDPAAGGGHVRFAFSKRLETLEEVARRLRRL